MMQILITFGVVKYYNSSDRYVKLVFDAFSEF